MNGGAAATESCASARMASATRGFIGSEVIGGRLGPAVLPNEHLPVFFQTRFERVVIDFLHRNALIERHDSGGCCALAGDHEDRFHADAGKGDVAGAESEGDEQI